ncbi:SAM-dependent methyltransferase [Haloprofundus marisrubri]|uniref:SAM-dependent methyltransferase n=1 Tax=Haloprofundus marisrubri TaxID=1514971 RepID=A0A0W1R8H7_9EURY|nr:class I SAM-dependent methyltransferase [Haloprofundus marisrubri]KTG09908.1 SAM-dependent methyltransferase [Haloprofundus marisrubri]
MKKTVDEHAARFSKIAANYDESQNSDEYNACASLVVDHADPGSDDVALDLGTGTGAIALALAPKAKRVVGRDISEGMMEQAEKKAEEQGIENVEFGRGTFREPDYDGQVDVVVSNFAMHHLADEEKREAIEVIAGLGPRKFVLGDVMFFGEPNPEDPFYSPEVDDPSTVGHLADCLTDAGFVLTAIERVHDQVGVLVAERFAGVDAAAAESTDVSSDESDE